MAVTITLTPLDDVVTDIAALSSGDTAILTEGAYNIAGNILHEGVTVDCNEGVILNSSGALFVAHITNCYIRGHAQITGGDINIIATLLIFQCEILTVKGAFDGATSDININQLENDITTTGQITYVSSTMNGDIIHTPGTDGLPASFDIRFILGGVFTTSTDKCFLNLKIGRVVATIGSFMNLDNTIGDVLIEDIEPSNVFSITTNSNIRLTLLKRSPELVAALPGCLLIVSGSIEDTLLTRSDITLENFKSATTGFSVDAASPVTVSIGRDVALKSSSAQISSRVTLAASARL